MNTQRRNKHEKSHEEHGDALSVSSEIQIPFMRRAGWTITVVGYAVTFLLGRRLHEFSYRPCGGWKDFVRRQCILFSRRSRLAHIAGFCVSLSVIWRFPSRTFPVKTSIGKVNRSGPGSFPVLRRQCIDTLRRKRDVKVVSNSPITDSSNDHNR